MFHVGTNGREVGPYVKAIATELRVIQARKHIPLREVARLSGVPYATVNKSINGKRAIDVDELARICAALGVEPSEVARAASLAVTLSDVLGTSEPDEDALRKDGYDLAANTDDSHNELDDDTP